jgi:zinc transporter ZupT
MRALYSKRLALSRSSPAIFAAALAILCAIAGARFEGGAARGRILVPVSGALLIAVALFGIAPELVRGAGWLSTIGLAAAAYVALYLLDAQGHPVCPSDSHGESFAASLAIATAFHAFLDGWGLSVIRAAATGAAPTAIFGAILLHKIPEGLALGAMLRASMPSLAGALAVAATAELMTVAGGVVGLWSPPAVWVNYPLALALGAFIFLGTHALRGERHHSH